MHQSTLLAALLLPFVSPMFLHDMLSTATCIMDPGHDPLVADITKIMECVPPRSKAAGSKMALYIAAEKYPRL
ncbi:uncharacterized protein H6S33_003809 [Morchella sextelata]|uniref:uncharacterized protein n=1 Tax=Morchella sextelata TaxID=1174677 RepID=UPI001D05014F|nr:uncharacterized protein H6S33_003809 [Morchella sextelata]KAH0606148.1 hypothetical protein H6S33_003809 [Morchella sextelata]